MSGIFPIIPPLTRVPDIVLRHGDAVPDVVGDVVDNITDPLGLRERLERLTDPRVWLRLATIGLGLWIVYLGVLVWIASNDKAQGAARGLIAGAATKNPAAAAAAMEG